MPYTDISINAFIKRLPPKGQAAALLMRVDRPIGTWLLLIPGWWAIALANHLRFDLFLLFAVGAFVMRSAGCIINDLWDRDLDSRVERTSVRPLVTGAITRLEAAFLLFALLVTGLCILLTLPLASIYLGFFSMLFVVAYPLMKRFTWWPQLFLGFTFNFGALIGWAATQGRLEPPALFLYAAGIFWTLGYDTIYAHQDKDDDALVGVKSTARLFGDQSKKWVALFYGAAILLLAAAFAAGGLNIIAIAALLAPAAYMAGTVRRWDMSDQLSSLTTFQSARNTGLLILGLILIFA
ncbi:MAG TPA: 4-hydroxybenzoate octaprenyltransferase [Alphaproteobacteria bacterium]